MDPYREILFPTCREVRVEGQLQNEGSGEEGQCVSGSREREVIGAAFTLSHLTLLIFTPWLSENRGRCYFLMYRIYLAVSVKKTKSSCVPLSLPLREE